MQPMVRDVICLCFYNHLILVFNLGIMVLIFDVLVVKGGLLFAFRDLGFVKKTSGRLE